MSNIFIDLSVKIIYDIFYDTKYQKPSLALSQSISVPFFSRCCRKPRKPSKYKKVSKMPWNMSNITVVINSVCAVGMLGCAAVGTWWQVKKDREELRRLEASPQFPPVLPPPAILPTATTQTPNSSTTVNNKSK